MTALTDASASIAAITRRDAPTLTPATPMRRATALLAESGPAAAVVDDSGALLGILTQKDCFRLALQASYHQEWNGTVADHMSRAPVCLSVETDLATAAAAFLSHSHRVFPVLDGTRLLGLLHREDVLAALVRLG